MAKRGQKTTSLPTTDKSRGALKKLADDEGYETFVVPNDVGGRFSVLTAVGLLPMAAAGVDIDEAMRGAAEARAAFMDGETAANDCFKYAALRNILHRKGKGIEILVNYEPALVMMGEWFKQLFDESEGKDQKGILRLLPTSRPIYIRLGSIFRMAPAMFLRQCCGLRSRAVNL